MPSISQYTVVVPAAGVGTRMQADKPKQYLTIAGKTVIEHTLENLLKHPNISHVVVVLNVEDKTFKKLTIASNPRVTTTIGGDERADSVLAGLNVVDETSRWVLVHDAARPCVSQADINALIALADQGQTGGLLATPVRDTMKRGHVEKQRHFELVKQTESRENLWHALTPQFFKLAILKKALTQAAKENSQITDEASAIELLGEQVILVQGKASNIKITQPEDLQLAEFYLTQNNQQGQYSTDEH
jgi:2-C-methyl-D-erythritol 4-phosphate cytidylyltransferase